MNINDILIGWYSKNRRDFWWRKDRNAYRIWISEIIFQQTRIAQGDSYLVKFLGMFPDVLSLASAESDEVLLAWQGLGYYSRALNLHRTARKIVQERRGVFPATYVEWLAMPGVGSYTAAVLASLTLGERVPAIDGNVRRIVSRWLALDSPASSSHFYHTAFSFLKKEMGDGDPGMFNEAMMDFGALVCTPVAPGCSRCPFRKTCKAFLLNKSTEFPVAIKKIKREERLIIYLILQHGKQITIRRRPGEGIWKNMYDFPALEYTRPWPTEKGIRNDIAGLMTEHVKYKEIMTFRHELSHRRLRVRVLMIEKTAEFRKNPKFIRINISHIHKYALPRPVQNILAALKNNVSLPSKIK